MGGGLLPRVHGCPAIHGPCSLMGGGLLPRVHGCPAVCFRRISEGLPVPREPAYADKRSQDGEAPAASE